MHRLCLMNLSVVEGDGYLPIFVLNFHQNHLKITIVIYLLLLLTSIHLESFCVQQGLHFCERLILLPFKLK